MKRDVLLAICETPGWYPADPPAVAGILAELLKEGWIASRPETGAYEPTPRALDSHPRFAGHPGLEALTPVSEPSPSRPPVADTAWRDRLIEVVVGMLHVLPLVQVVRIVHEAPEPDPVAWTVAEQIVENLR